MRVTFVLPVADLSGGVKVVATYAKRLKARGHEVVVVSTPPPAPSLRDVVRTAVKERRWPAVTQVPLRPTHLDGAGVEWRVLERNRPVTADDVPDADVVVATWWETAEWVWDMPRSKGAKAHFIQHFETWGGPAERVEAVWRLPMHRIVISKWLVELARERFGDADVSHVPNSVDTEQFHSPPRGKQAAPTVGVMYSTVPFKGCDVFLRAMERVAREVPGVRTEAFGREPAEWGPGLPPGASYTMSPAQDRIREIYGRCDVWACGSRAEGFHLPPLEAMACRCPVVSTRVGGPMDIIEDGVNGYLVDVEDAGALADRLVRVLTAPPERWSAMSAAALASARRFTWDQATEMFEAALRKAVARQREGGLPAGVGQGTTAAAAAAAI